LWNRNGRQMTKITLATSTNPDVPQMLLSTQSWVPTSSQQFIEHQPQQDKNSNEKERAAKKKSLEREEAKNKNVLTTIVERLANFLCNTTVEGGGGGNVDITAENNNKKNSNNVTGATNKY
jgi:hypothetical protein